MDYTRYDVPLITEAQSPKECKKQTPDYIPANPKKGTAQIGFRVKDMVTVAPGTLCLYNGTPLHGEFVFDSYDKYDNTCYVHLDRMAFTYNISLTQLNLL